MAFILRNQSKWLFFVEPIKIDFSLKEPINNGFALKVPMSFSY